MKLSKSMLVAGAVTTLGVAGLAGLGVASAQSDAGSGGNIVERIAARFNLNQDEVQAVFDEQKDEKRAEMEAEFSQRLQELVDSGELTADQKSLIENKAKEVRDAMQAERDELEAWAENNGIEPRYLMMGGKHGEDRLDKLVEGGKITEEQKTLLEQKRSELEDKRDEARDNLEQWAEDNGIDSDLIRLFGGRGHGHGAGFGKHI